MNNSFFPRVFFGLLIILLGFSFFLEQIGINLFGFNIFNLWPLILIFWGFWALINRRFVFAVFMLVTGFAFLLSNFFSFNVWGAIWPLFIIMLGVSILFKPGRKFGYSSNTTGAAVEKDYLNESVVFWSLDETVKSNNFSGGKLDCVFGGFKLDLSAVKVAKDGAKLEVNGVFGGGELILPKDVKIDVETSSVMGGVENRAASSGKAGAPTLHIKASAVFGGVEIKN